MKTRTPVACLGFFRAALLVAGLATIPGWGQTVIVGTYSSAISGDIIVSAGTSATFTGAGGFTGTNATIGSYALLTYGTSAVLVGKNFTMGSGSAYGQINVTGGNTLTFDSGTTLTGTNYVYGSAGSVINFQGIMNQTASTGYLYGATVTNSGTINVTGASNFYFGYYNGEIITNLLGGSIIANASTVNLHSVVNLGTVSATNNGILKFDGPFVTASFGNVNLSSGGHALITGNVDNTAATLNAPSGGVYELYGGTIYGGGTIAPNALTFTSSGGALDGVLYSGNFVLPASSAVAFLNGTTFSGSSATLGNYSRLDWNQNGTLAGKTITAGSGSSYGQISVGGGYSLTLDAATTVTGNVYLYGQAGSSINNLGIVNQTSGTGYVYGPSVTNGSGGQINVSAGASLYFGYYSGEMITNGAGGIISVDGVGTTAYLHGVLNQGAINISNSGVAYFTGNTTTAGLGSVVLSSAGRALINGILDNTSATVTAPTGGSYELAGGTINNGTIAAGALTFTGSGGTLSNLSLLGDLVLPASTTVTFSNGSAFTGTSATLGNYSSFVWSQNGTLSGKTITSGSGSAYAQIGVAASNTLTIASTTTITGTNYIYGNTGATIINQGLIDQTAGTGYVYSPTLTNASGGVVNANANSSLYFGYYSGETTTNAAGGILNANGSGANLYVHNVINQGTLNALNAGVIYFTGTNITANLGNVVLASGGRVLLNANIDNTAATLTAPTGGTYELYGGNITSGTIAAGALTFTNAGGVLSGASFLGNLTLPDSTTVSFINGTTFSGSVATLGNYSTLAWGQNGTLTGKTLTLGSGSAYAQIQVATGNSLTFGSGTAVTGNNYISGTTGSTIVNQGAITQTSGTGYLFGPNVTNGAGGTITANPGTSLYYGYYTGENILNASGGSITTNGASSFVYLHDIVNQGSLFAQNSGSLVFTGTALDTADLGSVTLSTGGRALLNGTLNNAAATLNTLIGGNFELYGGTIVGGTVAAGALGFTSSSGTLSGVTLAGDVSFASSGNAYFSNGTNFTGTNLSLGTSAGVYWTQIGTLASKAITMGSSSYLYLSGTNSSLTLDAATTVSGNTNIYSDGSAGTVLTNQGTINNTSGGASLYARTFTNAGTINVTAGSLSIGVSSAGYTFANPVGGSINVNGGTAYIQSPVVNGGVVNVQSGTLYTSTNLSNGTTGLVKGSGTIVGNLTMAGGTLAAGNSVGTLTLSNSTFTVTAPSVLQVEISGATADKLAFVSPTANVDLGSGLLALSISLLSAPTVGTTYSIISLSGTSYVLTGTFAGLPNTGDSLLATFGSQNYSFSVNYLSNGVTLNFAAVPEPTTYALLATGLGVIGLGWRRRRRA